jgi:hypothetical protein
MAIEAVMVTEWWGWLRDRLRYDGDTGKLYWITGNRNHIGHEAGTIGAKGLRYVRFRRDGKSLTLPASAIVWYLCTDEWPNVPLYHLDYNPDNNRIGNLSQENQATNKIRSNADWILERASEGDSASNIAKQLGVSNVPILDFFREHQLSICRNGGIYQDLPTEEIIRKYKVDKIHGRELARQYGCSLGVIQDLLMRNNIEANRARDYLDTLEDENLFEIVDTEAKAYLLGLIATDGSLYPSSMRNFLRLTLTDHQLVLDAAMLIGWKGNIEYKPPYRLRDNGREYRLF